LLLVFARQIWRCALLIGGESDLAREPSLSESNNLLGSDFLPSPTVASLFVDDSKKDIPKRLEPMIDLVYLRKRAVVHSRMKKAPHTSSMMNSSGGMAKNEAWRQYGLTRRREIVEQDELEGGKQFEMNPNYGVENYFMLAERVGGLEKK
jgi:hypothetical protein